MKRLLDRRGSALIWAMVVICVLFVAVAGILTLCMTYYNRTAETAARANAALNARSAIDFIAGDIVGGGDEFKPSDGGEQVIVFDFEGNDCTATISRESNEKIHIRAEAECGGASYTLNALLGGVFTTDDDGNVTEEWFFTGYLDK